MKYYWDNEDLKKDLKELEQMLKKEKNEEKKAQIRYYIDELIQIINEEKVEETYASKKECLISDITFCNKYRRYFELFEKYKEIRDKILSKYKITYDQIEEYFLDIDSIYKFKKYTTDECFEIAKDFFGNLDNIMYKNFLKLYKNKYNIIKVEEEKYDLEHDGCCLFVEGLNKPYIWISDKEGIQKANNLIHELGHATSLLNNPKRIIEAKDNFGTEIESLFCELVFVNDYLKDKNKVEQAIINLENLIINYGEIDSLINQKKIVDTLNQEKIKIDKEFYKKIKKEHNLTKNKVNNAIMLDSMTYTTYLVSYMTALELLHIYKQDKKDALKILKSIINDYQKDTYITIKKYLKDLPNIEKDANKIFEKSNKTLNKEFYKNL